MIKENRKHISAEQLKTWMDQNRDFTLIDVLPDEYYQQKHLPGAQNACVYEVAFSNKVKDACPDPALPVVVYGESSGYFASASAFTKLAGEGYGEVYELEGGLEAWQKAGYPLEAGSGEPVKEYDTPSLHPDLKTIKVSTEKSKINWTGRNLANFHHGYLKLKEGSLEIDDGVVTGGHFTIDMESVVCEDIGDAKMNSVLIKHLCSADFFETKKYPEGKFTITEAKLLDDVSPGAPNYRITGDLTLKEITHPITFDAVIGWNTEQKLFAQAAFSIDRTKWNVMYGSGRFFERLGMHLVNDHITLQLFITAG